MSKRNTIDKVISYFSPQKGLARDQARFKSDALNAKSGYDAAGKGRRNTWFRGSDSSANTETRASLITLRGRSRELVRNNPYAHRAIEARVSNVVGGGIIPAARCDNKKRQENAQRLMQAFIHQCDADGVNNLFGLQALAIRAQSEGGEALFLRQFVNDPKLAVPLKIRVLEGDFIDHTKEGLLGEGQKIVQGVQFGSDNSKQGLWLHDTHPGERGMSSFASKFVSIDQVAHIYEVTRPGQVRGIPAGVSAFMRMKGLDDFQDARIEQQKIAACLVGVIKDMENDGTKGDVLPDRLEPGMFPQLGYGKDITFNTPPSVSGHEEFVSTEQHCFAAAYGITYEALTGNLKGTNFTSGKMGFVEFGRNIERWRWNMLIPQGLKVVERWVIEAAEMAGHDMRGVSYEWTPPRREMIDQKSEIPAQIKAIRGGLKSWSETVRENGYDPEALRAEIERDNAAFDKQGIVLDSDARKTTNGGQFQMENSDDEKEHENDENSEE